MPVDNAGGAITTIAVAGFPLDASARELKNLCRLSPGFQRASARLNPGRPTVLFAKFESPEYAQELIFQLQDFVFDEEAAPDQKLRAEFARGEMKTEQQSWQGQVAHGPAGAPWSAPVPAEPLSFIPQKRQRTDMPMRPVAPSNFNMGAPPAAITWLRAPAAPFRQPAATGEAVDTLACKVLPEQSGQVQAFFEHLPGFVFLKDNGKNCFVKFDSHVSAVSALSAAQHEGLTLELARSSMQLKPGEGPQGLQSDAPKWPLPEHAAGAHEAFIQAATPAWGQPIPEWRPQPQPWQHAGGGGKGDDPGSGTDTIACKAGLFSAVDFEEFFGVLPGYAKMKHNIKNCFLKFETHEQAQEAIVAAAEAGFTAEFARFSLP